MSARLAWIASGIVLLAPPARAQDSDEVEAVSRQVAHELSSVYRYNSDISIHAGTWQSRFAHIRLGGAGSSEVVFMTLNPRLWSQVHDLLASGASKEHRSVEFLEYRFPVADCEGLTARMDELKAALLEAIAALGRVPDVPELKEFVVDGRYYELAARVGSGIEASFGVSENDPRLFAPLDAVVRMVEDCSQTVTWQVRRHEF